MVTVDPAEIARIRAKSGLVNDDRPLVAFLYVLIRDHLTPGQIEEIMTGQRLDVYAPREIAFCNGWLAAYAQDIAERLLGPESAPSEEVPGD